MLSTDLQSYWSGIILNQVLSMQISSNAWRGRSFNLRSQQALAAWTLIQQELGYGVLLCVPELLQQKCPVSSEGKNHGIIMN